MSERQGEQPLFTKTEQRLGVAVNSEAVPPQDDRASREQAKGDFLHWSERWLDPKATDGIYAEAKAFFATGGSVEDFSSGALKKFSEKAGSVDLSPADRKVALEKFSSSLEKMKDLRWDWIKGEWRNEFLVHAGQYVYDHQTDVYDALESGKSVEVVEEELLQEFSTWMMRYPHRQEHDVSEFKGHLLNAVRRNTQSFLGLARTETFSDWIGRRERMVYCALERGEPYEKIVEEHLRRGRERRGRLTAFFTQQNDERRIRAVCEAALRRFNAKQEK